MKRVSDVIAVVIDHGVFVHVARRLAREFKKVYYWSPADRAFPVCRDRCIGDGYEEVERIDSIWPVLAECDLFIFPDIGHADLQDHLVDMGKAVWGARHGDILESSRGKFLETMATTSLPVPKYQVIRGITNLRLFLKEQEDRYIKVSKIRGDFETFHWRSWKEDEGTLDEHAVRLGPLRDHVTFYVFEPIDTEIEDGVDTYCIDGRWPETVVHGMENKDKSYLCTFQKFSDLPDEVRIVNEAFGPILEKYEYKSRFSTEVRITPEGESYFIDPTCRFGSPPSQVEMELVGNWGEIIWHGAHGELVEMEPLAKFGVQALVKVDRSNWSVLDIPKEIDPWTKISFSCRVDESICVPPDPEGPGEIGWLAAIGDTIEEAVATLRKHSEELPSGCECEFQSIAGLISEIHTAEEAGMTFTPEKVPEPAIVIE